MERMTRLINLVNALKQMFPDGFRLEEVDLSVPEGPFRLLVNGEQFFGTFEGDVVNVGGNNEK